ncbi:hypothetical protein MCOR03_008676 [Pyricularia oryzae]|nr:hypothetical protein MCOR17_007000 [Pyricularia oryzae]KAI6482659.1 hypothetical protein MCOR11_010918 [Pyricularia oryzae]KAI6525938.1 hypothetical protein MCOR10_004578 [Pyricularia oryzae]KAI6535014.1 hypothetical protein MCOR05_006109 [Pyricularia oryzae]KAI6551884.1 hypothetical protein MCOR03_008676 [Pyricularia oryzae]
MWLINTQTLALEYFSSHNKVPYAILSHTWEEEEVTFQEFHSLDTARSRKGFAKIAKTCSIAKDQGLGYAWVDTCCINKEKSAELSEAINSMFKWYTNAKVCLVFLSDLAQEHESDWASCRWFTRGWTLQELIAPSNVDFYDAIWNFKGTKKGLLDLLSSITGIDDTILSGETRLSELPVARKMSWAAQRRTSRDEDIAYCLMGLFDLNMPLLYGEGQKAFIRLQEQILDQTRDLSLLAWTAQDQPPPYEDDEDGNDTSQQFRGIFASSPVEFSECGNIISPIYPFWVPRSKVFTITSKALHSKWPLSYGDLLLEKSEISSATEASPWMDRTPKNFVLRLNCLESSLGDKVSSGLSIVVLLRQTSKGHVRTGFRKTYYICNMAMKEEQPEVYFTAPTHVSPWLSSKICSQYTGSLWIPDPTSIAGPRLQDAFAPPLIYDRANRVFRRGEGPGIFRIYLDFSIDVDSSLQQAENGNRVNFLNFLLVASHRGDAKTGGDDDDLESAFSCAIIPETSDSYHTALKLLREQNQRAIDRLVETELSCFSRPLPNRVELESRDAAQAGELLLDIVRVPLEEFKLVDRPAKDDYLYSIKLEWKPASREGLGLLSR